MTLHASIIKNTQISQNFAQNNYSKTIHELSKTTCWICKTNIKRGNGEINFLNPAYVRHWLFWHVQIISSLRVTKLHSWRRIKKTRLFVWKKVKNVWKQLKLLENCKQHNVETVKHGKKKHRKMWFKRRILKIVFKWWLTGKNSEKRWKLMKNSGSNKNYV